MNTPNAQRKDRWISLYVPVCMMPFHATIIRPESFRIGWMRRSYGLSVYFTHMDIYRLSSSKMWMYFIFYEQVKTFVVCTNFYTETRYKICSRHLFNTMKLIFSIIFFLPNQIDTLWYTKNRHDITDTVFDYGDTHPYSYQTYLNMIFDLSMFIRTKTKVSSSKPNLYNSYIDGEVYFPGVNRDCWYSSMCEISEA